MVAYEHLTGPQKVAYGKQLAKSHRIRSTIALHSRDEVHEEDLDVLVTSGQVDVDDSADIVRQLSLEVAGERTSHLAPDKFLQVRYGVYVDALTDWVDVPVFFGPISRLSFDSNTAHVEASSKEALMVAPVWFGYGRSVVDPQANFPQSLRAFIRMVAASVGETRFALGHAKRPMLSLERKKWERIAQSDEVWAFLQHLARGANRDLVYRANGVLALESRRAGQPRFVFADGPGGTLLNIPHVEWDLQDARNSVRVLGPKTKKAKTSTVRAKTHLPRSSPISPGALSRGGAPRFLMETVEVDAVLSLKEAREIARTTLRRTSLGTMDVSFDCLPVPHLEPGDLVAVQAEGFHSRFILHKFTLPLTADTMSVGFTKRLTPQDFRRTRT